MFLRKGVLKIHSKFTGEHPCRSVISIFQCDFKCDFNGCSPENLLHVFRTPFRRNTSARLLLKLTLLNVIFEVIIQVKVLNAIGNTLKINSSDRICGIFSSKRLVKDILEKHLVFYLWFQKIHFPESYFVDDTRM